MSDSKRDTESSNVDDQEILSLLRKGMKINAIKLHREKYETGLLEAKTAVEELARKYGVEGNVTKPVTEPRSGPCFIATAAFGCPLVWEVLELRRFKDRFLSRNPLGRAFIRLYNLFSPSVAKVVAEHKSVRSLALNVLQPLGWAISKVNRILLSQEAFRK